MENASEMTFSIERLRRNQRKVFARKKTFSVFIPLFIFFKQIS